MSTAPAAFARRSTGILILAALMLAGLPASAQVDGAPVELTGEASVVIFDDPAHDRSELRYYLVEPETSRETRLHFRGRVPDVFKTGRKLRVRGTSRGNGVDVDSVEQLDGAGGGADGGGAAAAALAAPETRAVLTLLVDFNDATVDSGSYGTTVQEVRDRMYNEPKSVAGLYFNASLATLTLDPDADGDGAQDVFHVSIDDSYIGGDPAQCDPSGWVNKASAAWELANPGKDINIYRHRLLITPNYWDWVNRHCSWGGVAQVGCGSWCWAIGADPDVIMHGVIVHELGHNLGFNHARTDGNNNGFNSAESTDSEYGDNSDMMGSSRNWKKFNAPHAEDKGWTDPVEFEIRPVVAGANPQSFDLLPLDEEAWDWPGLRALRIARSNSTDYYIAFRRAAGEYNDLNSEYRDRVAIYYGYDNSTYSYFVTSLGAGESFVDQSADLVVTATGAVTVNSGTNTTTAMGVEVCQQACSSTPAPSGLTATAQATDAIALQWTDNSGDEDGFDVERSPDGSAWAAVTTEPPDTTNYLDVGLASGTTYYYRVRASAAAGDSGWSNTASASTFTLPPTADFSFTANDLQVDFSDLSSDPDGSIVGWTWDFGDGSGATTANPSHSYATPGTWTVSLTVTDDDGATDSVGKDVTVTAPAYTDYPASSEISVAGTASGTYLATADDDGNTQSITERESGGKKSSRYTYLEHIWVFNISASTSATLLINAWQSVSPDGDNFDFQWSANGGPWSAPTRIAATSDGTPLSIALPADISGEVRVRVTDTDRSAGHRDKDTVYVDFLQIRVSNGPPEPFDNTPPSGLTATATSWDTVELNWADNGSNEDGFRIERDSGTGFTEIGITGPNAGASASYTDSGLAGSTTYSYRVRSFKGADVSAWSDPATATTDPAPAIGLEVVGYKVKGRQQADLTWSDAAGADVDIFRDDTLLVTTANDGAYTDAIDARGGGSYRYRLCEAGSITQCSGEVTVTF